MRASLPCGHLAPRDDSVRNIAATTGADACISQSAITMKPRTAPRCGMVLVIVLVVVAMLSLAAYTYCDLMRSHHESAKLTTTQLKARMMADSGVEYLRTVLKRPADLQAESGGLYNSPEQFKLVAVSEGLDPRDQGYFTIVAPALDDDGNLAGIRYGLENESTRLNLNMLLTAEAKQAGSGSTLLMALPSMTEDVADAILDWIDADEEPRENGAESEYYAGLQPPYAPKNAPPDTVEELLRVKGVTPELLFGKDVNRNGRIDSNELDTGLDSQVGPTLAEDAPSGSLDRGWSAYLTLHSRERNLRPDGRPRIYLNSPDLVALYAELQEAFPPEWANFIIAYRQYGPYGGVAASSAPTGAGDGTSSSKTGANGTPSASPTGGGAGTPASPATSNGTTSNANLPNSVSAASIQIDLNIMAKTKLTQVLDMIDVQTQYKNPGDGKMVILNCPFKSDLVSLNIFLPVLMDHTTINPAATVPGRVNINQASAAILRGVPGMNDTLLDGILSRREVELTEEKPNRRHETWLLSEGLVTLQEMKSLQPFITATGHVYRAQVVGFFQDGQAASRVEAIFDATGSMPRVVLWRDMSHLGRGYAMETLGAVYEESPLGTSNR